MSKTTKELYEEHGSLAFDLSAVCVTCGCQWGAHVGLNCPMPTALGFIPLGVSPTPTLDKMEAEKEEPIGDDYDEGDEWVASIDGHIYEPIRPALDWNKPTPFDPFNGFVTTSHTQDQQASQNHALQRCADFDGLVMKVR